MSARGSQRKVGFVKATGAIQLAPGVGPYLPQGAAKVVSRPMYRGGAPRPTGVFDAKEVIAPTKMQSLYQNGGMPCRVDMASKEGEEEEEDSKPVGKPAGGRGLIWITPIKDLNLEVMLPIFVDGLREKMEPLVFMAEKGV